MALFKSYLEDFSRVEPEVIDISGESPNAWYDSIDKDYGFNSLMNMGSSDAWILYLAVHESGHSWTVIKLMKFIPNYLIICSVVMVAFLGMAESLAWIIWLIVGLLSVIIVSRTNMWNEMAAEEFVKKLIGPGFRLSMSLELIMEVHDSFNIPAWRYADMLDDLKDLEIEYWRN